MTLYENLEETDQETRRVDTKVRGRGLHGTAEGRRSEPCLASSSSLSFPGRNESPGTHGGLMVKNQKEDTSCQRFL